MPFFSSGMHHPVRTLLGTVALDPINAAGDPHGGNSQPWVAPGRQFRSLVMALMLCTAATRGLAGRDLTASMQTMAAADGTWQNVQRTGPTTTRAVGMGMKEATGAVMQAPLRVVDRWGLHGSRDPTVPNALVHSGVEHRDLQHAEVRLISTSTWSRVPASVPGRLYSAFVIFGIFVLFWARLALNNAFFATSRPHTNGFVLYTEQGGLNSETGYQHETRDMSHEELDLPPNPLNKPKSADWVLSDDPEGQPPSKDEGEDEDEDEGIPLLSVVVLMIIVVVFALEYINIVDNRWCFNGRFIIEDHQLYRCLSLSLPILG